MTTRAGFVGLLTGLTITLIIYLAFSIWPVEFWFEHYASTTEHLVLIGYLSMFLVTFGGWLAACWSGSGRRWRCAVLGTLAGGVAGSIVFCLWGAAQVNLYTPRYTIWQTISTLMTLMVGSGFLGCVGGWLACPRRRRHEDVFNKEDPQMAMNVAITAVPASIFSAVLCAAYFPRLINAIDDRSILEAPLVACLFMVLISHFALMMIVPHETRQAEHRCGMDEVKMAAFVSIAAGPVLALLLLIIYPYGFSNWLVTAMLLASGLMSLISLIILFKIVLPRRASFPVPANKDHKIKAVLFGSISNSRASRLVVLCIGCGLAMVLPLCMTVVPVLINLGYHPADINIDYSTEVPWDILLRPLVPWDLFRQHVLVSLGTAAAAIGFLVLIYIIYLNLGKRFNQRKTS